MVQELADRNNNVPNGYDAGMGRQEY